MSETVTALCRLELDDDTLVINKEGRSHEAPLHEVATMECSSPDEAIAYGVPLVKAFNACFAIAEQLGTTPEKVAAEIGEAFELLKLFEHAEISSSCVPHTDGKMGRFNVLTDLDAFLRVQALLARLTDKETK